MGLTSGGVLSQLHNVTLALELLKDEGLLNYPIDPKGECVAPVGAVESGDASVGVGLLLGRGVPTMGGAAPTASTPPRGEDLG